MVVENAARIRRISRHVSDSEYFKAFLHVAKVDEKCFPVVKYAATKNNVVYFLHNDPVIFKMPNGK
jgi:hypothetical protein